MTGAAEFESSEETGSCRDDEKDLRNVTGRLEQWIRLNCGGGGFYITTVSELCKSLHKQN